MCGWMEVQNGNLQLPPAFKNDAGILQFLIIICRNVVIWQCGVRYCSSGTTKYIGMLFFSTFQNSTVQQLIKCGAMIWDTIYITAEKQLLVFALTCAYD